MPIWLCVRLLCYRPFFVPTHVHDNFLITFAPNIDTIRTICLCMNACTRTRPLHMPIELLCLFQPNTNTIIKRQQNDCNWHTCMTFSRLCCWNPAVFTVAVTQHWFWVRLVRSVSVSLQHTSFECHSFVYPFSTPFSVLCRTFSGLFCYTLFIYTQHRNRNQPKTFVTVSWLSTVAVPVRYSQRLNVCICFFSIIDNKVFFCT